jgi:hypothetical protein
MPAPPVHAIELSGVAAQKLPHPPCDGAVSGSQQQVEVVGQQGPCVTGSLGFTQDPLQPFAEIIAAGIPLKNLAALDPSVNDMVQGTRCIAAGSAWHD